MIAYSIFLRLHTVNVYARIGLWKWLNGSPLTLHELNNTAVLLRGDKMVRKSLRLKLTWTFQLESFEPRFNYPIYSFRFIFASQA